MKTFYSLCLVLFLSSCHIIATKPSQQADIHVGRYESIPWGFSTNTWWVEGPSGVVLIDTQFLPSEINNAVDIAEEYTGKNVVLAFVLHANPDKFNGTLTLKKRGIRVVSSEQVVNRIPEVDALRRQWFYKRYKPDYPETLVLPDSIGNSSTKIKAAGLNFDIHVLGASVSKDHIAVKVGDHLFAGDVLANKHHSWMELGMLNEWLATLDKLSNLNARHTYPGRGYAAGSGLILQQKKYLTDVRDIVKKYKSKNTSLTKSLKKDIITEIKTLYPNYGNDFFLNLGIKPVWESL